MLPFGLRQVEEIEDHISASTSCHHPPLKDLVCSRGTTPLLLACSYGDLEAVKRIVEYWEVSVEATAVYCIKPMADLDEPEWMCEHFADASPLFVAACNGHLDIVRYLVEKEADVNATTKKSTNQADGGLTPLHGAFLRSFCVKGISKTTRRPKKINEIVIFLLESGADPNILPLDRSPIWTYESCGVEATIALINHGLDLNQCCRDFPRAPNSTIIHDWAGRNNQEEDSIVIVKLLVEKGVNLLAKDDEGFTPLLRAAYGNRGYLGGHGPNLKVLDFLLEREEFNRMEKIDAMELAGAVILNTFSYPESSFKAFDYWRRALQLRQMMEGAGPIIKIPLQLGSGGGKCEWITSEQLEHVVQHPSEHKYQAFLVGMRIISGIGSEVFVSLFEGMYLNWHELIRFRAFVKLLYLSWAALESLGRFEEPEWGLKVCVKEATSNLLEALSGLRNDPSLFTIETIMTSLQFILKTDHILFEEHRKENESYFIEDDFQDIKDDSHKFHMASLLKLVKLLAGLPRQILDQNTFKETFELFVQRARRDENGRTLLLMTCKPSYLYSNSSMIATIRLLLDSGAEPTETDLEGNAPLHVLARYHHRSKKLVASAAKLLLSKGAHLDQVNNSRKTAADVWIEQQKVKKRQLRWNENEGNVDDETEDEGADDDETGDEGTDDEDAEQEEDAEVEAARWKALLPSWLRDDSVPKLQCLTARIIRSHKVPFSRLPSSLHRFVKMH